MLVIVIVIVIGSRLPAATAQETAPISTAVQGDIERHVRSLGSKNGWVSLEALDYLPYFGRAAVPALLDGLASIDSNVRCLSAVALARIPDARSIPALVAHLDDPGGLVLHTLSEDGETLHDVYPKPEHTVGQQALTALHALTGKRFTKKADWLAWWEKDGASFVAPPLHETEWPKMPPQARWLKGVKICIDPGHGGDRQKQGYKRGLTYMSEADLNLRVSRYVRDLLEKAGAVVTLTREGDQDIGLRERDRIAERAHCDFFVSIHHNWSPSLETVSTTTWYHLTPDEKPASIDLARALQDEVFAALGLSVDPPKSGGLMSDGLIYKTGFGVLGGLPADMPGCLCEMTYYSNFAMERKLRDLEFNRKEAWGVFAGLARYMAGGIPRAELVSSEVSNDGDLVLQVQDGLDERGDWAKPFKVFSEHTLVKVDGKVVPHEYDPGTGKIRVPGSSLTSLTSGEHTVEVVLININKNHSWPKRISFTRGAKPPGR